MEREANTGFLKAGIGKGAFTGAMAAVTFAAPTSAAFGMLCCQSSGCWAFVFRESPPVNKANVSKEKICMCCFIVSFLLVITVIERLEWDGFAVGFAEVLFNGSRPFSAKGNKRKAA